MYCTVLNRCMESLDCKCTVLSRCRKSWTANVLYCAEQMQGGLDCKCTVRNRFRKRWTANVLYCAEQMQGEAGLQMYYAEQVQEKLDG